MKSAIENNLTLTKDLIERWHFLIKTEEYYCLTHFMMGAIACYDSMTEEFDDLLFLHKIANKLWEINNE